MTTSSGREPLISEPIDLRNFPFMPLDVVRLRDSDLAAMSSAEGFRAAVLLWCASWHQVPASSLPTDDRILAKLAGFGRDIEKWADAKADALRGFIKCSDGRFYHPIIADKAIEAWGKKRNRIKILAEAREAKELKNTNKNKETISIIEPITEPIIGPIADLIGRGRGREIGKKDKNLLSERGSDDDDLFENSQVKTPVKRARKSYPTDFEEFWKGYPTDANMSKAEAAAVWRRLPLEEKKLAIDSLPAFRAYCASHKDYRPVHACRYLAKERYQGHAAVITQSVSKVKVLKDSVAGLAWESYRRKSEGKGFPWTNGVWYMPTEFPPGFDHHEKELT